MARPYFTGNYGSALARVDTRPIIEAGRAQGQMYANMGAQIGGMIQQYGLNKVKRAKLTGEIEAYYEENPEALSQIGMTGDEAQDKKDLLEREKFMKGDMSMAQLEGYAGKLARGEVLRSKKLQDQSRIIQNQLGEQNLGLREKLEGATVALAEAQTQRAETENRIANMSEEQLLALAKLTTEERRLALQSSIDERKTFTGTDRGEIAKKTAELSIKGQEQSLEQGAERLKASKSANQSYDAMVNAMGGLEALAQFEMEGRKLNHEKIKTSMKLMASQGKAMELNAMARVIAAGNVDVGKQYLDLHSQRGKLMSETITDPMGGGEITFEKYLELNNEEGDNDYPLTGPNAGFAGTLNASYKAIGLEMDQLLQNTPVQVDDGSGGAGAQGQVGWMNMDGSHQKGETITLDAGIDDPWAGKQVEVVGFDTDKNRTLIKLLDDPNVWEGDVRQALSEGISLQQIYDREKNEKKREWMVQNYPIEERRIENVPLIPFAPH